MNCVYMCLSLPAVCFFSYFKIHLNLSASFLLYAQLSLHQSLSLIVHTLSVNLLSCVSHFIYLGSFFVYSCSPHLPAYPNHLLSRPFLCLCTFPPLIITYIHSFYPPTFFFLLSALPTFSSLPTFLPFIVFPCVPLSLVLQLSKRSGRGTRIEMVTWSRPVQSTRRCQ